MLESLLATLQQWLLFSGSVLAVGCVAWRFVAAPPAQVPDSMTRSVAKAGLVAGGVLVVAWALRLVVQVRGFRDPFVPLWDDVSFLLFETTWGTVWMAQGVVLPLLLAAFAWARGGSVTAWKALIAPVLGLVATLSLASHAMGVERGKVLLVTVDGVHALAAGCWIGTLAVILTVGRPAGGTAEARASFAAQLRAFSPMAMVSVAALLLAGVSLSWVHIGALSNLWLTGYGRVLLAKVGLAGTVLLAGFLNWRKGLAVSDTEGGAVATHRRASLEVGLATGVLLLTAVLVHSVKP